MALQLEARKYTNTSCYVCARIPHARGHSVPMQPFPANLTETVSVLLAFSITSSLQNDKLILKTDTTLLNHTWINFNHTAVRWYNVTALPIRTDTKKALYTPIMLCLAHISFTVSVCFELACSSNRTFVGATQHCNFTSPVACGLPATVPCTNKWGAPFLGRLNTSLPCNPGCFSCPSLLMDFPSEDGYGQLVHYVWQCGPKVYQVLPPGWCGTCHMAKLKPGVVLTDTLHSYHTDYSHRYFPGSHHRSKRNTRTRIAPNLKLFGGFVPWWGTVNNAHAIDKLALDLENLTSLTTQGFEQTTKLLKILGNTELQDRMGLDYLLAASGGLCHVIGQECCTWAPEDLDNLTHIISHMNDLLIRQRASDTLTPDGWSWFMGGVWKTWLTKLAGLLLVAIILLFLVSCCIIPLIRRLVTSLFNLQLAKLYVELPQHD